MGKENVDREPLCSMLRAMILFRLYLAALMLFLVACGGGSGSTGTSGGSGGSGGAAAGVVHVVLFTHIEDNSPGGALGSVQSRDAYHTIRAAMIGMAELAQKYELVWVLQPDWKVLEAARQYEDTATMANTGGKNFLLYMRDDLGAFIDPHSHENGGYNYTDVAHLLELLEVGGSTVIGGHIWDPELPQFQEWDRFREAQAGLTYPQASWRGDVLIGAGTPQHVNDPLVSGAWRPIDRDHFFTDDPSANIIAFGSWHDQVAGVQELVDLYANATVAPDSLLTASWNIRLADLTAPNGMADVEQSVMIPMAALRDQGRVVTTDFTSLVVTWQSQYGGEPFLYQP